MYARLFASCALRAAARQCAHAGDMPGAAVHCTSQGMAVVLYDSRHCTQHGNVLRLQAPATLSQSSNSSACVRVRQLHCL